MEDQNMKDCVVSHEDLASEYLKYLVIDGLHGRYGEVIPQDVYDRIELEYGVIIPNKFVDYILMIWDIHDFCRTPDRVNSFCALHGLVPPPDGIIPIGPGRGSAGGSMVCYAIGITQCDPLLFGLFFERFLNPERIAYPDIDYDISQRYRHIGIAYIADKYGEEHVSQIITYGTLAKNMVVLEVLKAAGVSSSMISDVKKTLPDDPSITLADMVNDEKFLTSMKNIQFNDTIYTVDKSNVNRIIANNRLDNDNREKAMMVLIGVLPSTQIYVKSSWTWQNALNIMLRLEGLSKHESTHAAGVVVAPVELESNIPLMKKSGTGPLSSQYDMVSLEALGFLKMDALGLRTVDVNHDAANYVRKLYDPNFSINNIGYDDKQAIKLINDGDTIGIFQIEGTGFTQLMKDLDIGGFEVERFADRDISKLSTIEVSRGLEIQDFMWISAGLALYRPGPLDAIIDGKTMVKHLVDRKLGKEPILYLFPEEKLYLEETYGVLVYQEQVMARVRQMTGCTYGRADILRKAMGKKDPVLMKEQMDWFKNAAIIHEFSDSSLFKDLAHKQRIINRASDEIEKFARYGFNKAHTVEYGHICYHNAYYKSHYPDCFFCTLLNTLNESPKQQTVVLRDAMKHGIKILSPDINKSDVDFVITAPNEIRFGLSAIKQFGKSASVVMNDRLSGGEYGSVEEFRIRISASDLNKTVMENLAKCGAFDTLLQDNNADVQFDSRASLVESMTNICEALNKLRRKKNAASPAPTVQEALNKWVGGAGSYTVVSGIDDKIQYSIWEKEILKYYISAHPIDRYVDEIRRWSAIEYCEDEFLPNEFYIAGFIEGCHETVVKKEGRNKNKKMGFVMVGTAYRIYEGTMFPGIYESCLPYLKSGTPVVMKGKRNEYQDKITIQVEYIRLMSNEGIRDCPECHIIFNNPDDIVGMLTLKSMFDEHFGGTKVFIHINDGYYSITIECAQTIALNDHIINYVESIGRLAYKKQGLYY